MNSQPNWRTQALRGLAAMAVALPLASAIGMPAWAQDSTTSAAPTAPAADAQAPAAKPIVEQGVLDLLKKVSDKLAGSKALTVSIRDMRDEPTDQGQIVSLISSGRVTIERPNKLRAKLMDRDASLLFVYDGKTFSIYDETKGFYTTTDAPPTLDAFITDAAQTHGVYFAIADFLMSDPYAGLSKGVTNAYEVGKVAFGDAMTRHVVVAAPGVEWQLWVDEKTDLPRLFAVTYTDADSKRQPHFLVEFQKWKLDAKPPAKAFTFKAPKSAMQIEFLPATKQ